MIVDFAIRLLFSMTTEAKRETIAEFCESRFRLHRVSVAIIVLAMVSDPPTRGKNWDPI